MIKLQYNCVVFTKKELYQLLPNTNINIDINYNWLYNRYGYKYDFDILDEKDILSLVYHISNAYYIKNFNGFFAKRDNQIILNNDNQISLNNTDIIVLDIEREINYQCIINELNKVGIIIDIDFLNKRIGILEGECDYEYK